MSCRASKPSARPPKRSSRSQTRERLWNQPFLVPVPGTATSSFGRRTILNGQPRGQHTGTDFQAATGTPVVAPNRGRIALAADQYFPGKTIIIDHGLGVYSYLAHLSEFTVAEGAIVERGQRIALSGATGRVTGPHLHWTMRFGSARVDPLSLVEVLERSRSLRSRTAAPAARARCEVVRVECESRHWSSPHRGTVFYGRLANPSAGAGAGLVSHLDPAMPPGQLTCMLRAQL